jgi:hypothetical protein
MTLTLNRVRGKVIATQVNYTKLPYTSNESYHQYCCRTGILILDPESKFFKSWTPDLNFFHPRSRIWILDLDRDLLPISDPGSRGLKGTRALIIQ